MAYHAKNSCYLPKIIITFYQRSLFISPCGIWASSGFWKPTVGYNCPSKPPKSEIANWLEQANIFITGTLIICPWRGEIHTNRCLQRMRAIWEFSCLAGACPQDSLWKTKGSRVRSPNHHPTASNRLIPNLQDHKTGKPYWTGIPFSSKQEPSL